MRSQCPELVDTATGQRHGSGRYVRVIVGAAAFALMAGRPVTAVCEQNFFTQPTTDTQPIDQPGMTLVDTAGPMPAYLVEGLIGINKRVEVGVDVLTVPVRHTFVGASELEVGGLEECTSMS